MDTPDDMMADGFMNAPEANFDGRVAEASNANADLFEEPVSRFYMYWNKFVCLLNKYFYF